MGNAHRLEEQISYALTALSQYRAQQSTSESEIQLIVDVRDLSRVFVREGGEKEKNSAYS